MRFMQVHSFYDENLRTVYRSHRDLARMPFTTQIDALLDEGISASHLMAPHLAELGYETFLTIANAVSLQTQWALENAIAPDTSVDLLGILARQIESFQPDILYVTDPIAYDSRFLRSVSWKPRLVVGWRAASIPPDTDWSAFDLILSSDDIFRRRALELGARAVDAFLPGFPRWLGDRVVDQPKEWDVLFSGQATAEHQRRVIDLTAVAEASTDPQVGFDFGCFLARFNQEPLPDPLRLVSRPPLWGMDMLRGLRSGRIVLNAHIDLIKVLSQNMRLFEATGVGSFLLTEHSDALHTLFTPGEEVETYRSVGEMTEKIRYYLQRPAEREAIALRGWERCRRDHSMDVRARQFDALIRPRLLAASKRIGWSGARVG